MRLAGVLAVLAACYDPRPPEGAPCVEDRDCPAPQVCVVDRCRADGLVEDAALDAPIDADPTCTCTGATLTCASASAVCPLGCMETAPGARCIEVVPSNEVELAPTQLVSTDIVVQGGVATLDTDTGAIDGALVRAAGPGVVAGIHYATLDGNGAALGVFTVQRLTIASGATLRLVGTRAAVLVVATTATIEGTIDGAAGCAMDPSCAGPGGGTGGGVMPATGCGAGVDGSTGMTVAADGGGGGGGGGSRGGAGGTANAVAGGAGGDACIPETLEPLLGGGGGGRGGRGSTTTGLGGGGGGALQLTAGEAITVEGIITMAGAGGPGGPPEMAMGGGGAAGGGGGGAGGGILLEAPRIEITGTLAANGGGGGSGGYFAMPGNPGAAGRSDAMVAPGGSWPNDQAGDGGAGAAAAIAAGAGQTTNQGNAGGGGGGVGRIYLRTAPTTSPMITGVVSPVAGTGELRTR